MARGIDTKCIHLEEDEGQWKNMGQMTHIQQNLMFHLCFLLSAAQPSVLSHPAAMLPHNGCL